MGKIVAIGGGAVGVPGTREDTLSIDKEIIKISGKKKPELLFLPTASLDANGYYEQESNYFGKLGCNVDVLYLVNDPPSKKEIEHKIKKSDIIYVGVGNTCKMLEIWRKLGVDKFLKEAYKNDIVLSGLSAGAICWFKYGSDDFCRISGLGFINAIGSPHHIFVESADKRLYNIMKKTPGIGIALDDFCAIEIIDDTYRIITSKDEITYKGKKYIVGAHKIYWKNNKWYSEVIPKTVKFNRLSSLLKK